MRIGIDLRPITGRKAGIGTLVANIVSGLSAIDGTAEYVGFISGGSEMPPQARGFEDAGINSKSWLWHNTVARRLKRGIVDVYMTTSAIVPSMVRGRCVLICCDLTPIIFPQFHTLKVRVANLFMKRAARNALKVITISNYSANDIARYLDVEPGKIVVAYPGVEEKFFDSVSEQELLRTGKKMGLPEKFILFVGSFEPRKNLTCVFRAMKYMREKHGRKLELVVAGGTGWRNKPVYADLKNCGLEDSVHFLGYVEDDDLPALYRLADTFVFPSLYEGFGMPVLEAMACGTPVVASNAASIPEALGNAGIGFDPRNHEALASALLRLENNAELRSDMIKKGLAHARSFSWANCAGVINQTLSKCGGK